MKITITYRTSVQVGEDSWDTYTKVIYCDETMTLKELHEKLTGGWINKNFNAEIHFVEE